MAWAERLVAKLGNSTASDQKTACAAAIGAAITQVRAIHAQYFANIHLIRASSLPI